MKGFGILVLDPTGYASLWDADFVTSDPHEFLDVVFASERCVVIVDESGDMIGRYGGEMNKLATRAAHNGHRCFFIAQRATQIDPTVRGNCENVITFAQAVPDAKQLAIDFVDDKLKEAVNLEKLQYMYKIGFNPVIVDKVNFAGST